ncbi:hypothetical protein V6N11_062457 [Hibiscus sabdariffa]|uniref:PA domain-containing protein n=1 Tax=Hibiscus sabdariffa TaxID=183260 RepID=A0ABR2PT52_9ROSI
MLKTTTVTFLAVATSFFILHFSSPPKSYYHSLFISDSLADNASVSHHLYTLTRRPHVAGSQANAEAASYVLSTLNACNVKAHAVSYEVLLTYPDSHVAHEVVPTFHTYAKSGSVTGPVVYVNYGRVEDYETLKEIGVNVTGTVVLTRYGKISRGDIVLNEFEAGAIGALVFTDRKDYGGGTGYAKWFPDDKWMPPSGVQVGTVYNGSGDPTTPGWASTEGCERVSIKEVERSGHVPLIPSLPISSSDGETILRSIGGQVAKDDWQGSKDAPTYKVGPGPGVVNLDYNGKQVIETIQNVIGVIEGVEEPDRFVILGNHRDAWTFGAFDPNSGTASLLEIGSTEWVEENRELLASRAVAYVNVDSAVSGPGFHASATPQLDDLLKQAAQQVQDPDNSSQTIYEQWAGSTDLYMIGRLGGVGSDHAAFLQHIGAPAADMCFGEAGFPVYHSMYDDYTWTENFGDPMFKRNIAAASVWGLVALRLADEEFLPFNYHSYTFEIQRLAEDLENEISDKGIDDAIENAKNLNTAESWDLVQHEVWRVSRAVRHASLVLNGKLT